MGLFEGLDLDDPQDRREAVRRYTTANTEWAEFCRRHHDPGVGAAVSADPEVAAEASQMVADIDQANQELNAAFDRVLGDL